MKIWPVLIIQIPFQIVWHADLSAATNRECHQGCQIRLALQSLRTGQDKCPHPLLSVVDISNTPTVVAVHIESFLAVTG